MLSTIVSPFHVEFRNSTSVYTSKDAKTSPEMEQLGTMKGIWSDGTRGGEFSCNNA